MKRVKLTSIFLAVSGSLVMAPTLVLIIGLTFLLVLGTGSFTTSLSLEQTIPLLIVFSSAFLHYAAAYMLLTYRALGIRVAQICFLLNLTNFGYEAASPSVTQASLEMAGLSAPEHMDISYRILSILFAFLYLWLLRLFDEKVFRANYAIVSKAQKNLFDHLYGRK